MFLLKGGKKFNSSRVRRGPNEQQEGKRSVSPLNRGKGKWGNQRPFGETEVKGGERGEEAIYVNGAHVKPGLHRRQSKQGS